MRYLPPFEFADWLVKIAVSDHDILLLQSWLTQKSPELVRKLFASPAIGVWSLCHIASSQTLRVATMHSLEEWFQANAQESLVKDLTRFEHRVNSSCSMESNEHIQSTWFDAPNGQADRSVYSDRVFRLTRRCLLSEVWARDEGQESDSNVVPWLTLVELARSAAEWCIVRLCVSSTEDHADDVGESQWSNLSGSKEDALSFSNLVWEAIDPECPREIVLAVLDSFPGAGAGADDESSLLPSEPSSATEELLSQRRQDALRQFPDYVDGFPGLLRSLGRLDERDADFRERLHVAKMRSMKELAYGASHEINNPLANISTRAQTLLRDETNPERRQKLAMINSQAFRAHEMISNMMLFAHPPDLEPTRFDLRELLVELIAEMSDSAKSQATEILVVDLDAIHCSLKADRTHVLVMLQALVRNSLEALSNGGTIHIRVEGSLSDRESPFDDSSKTSRDGICIAIADTGPGVPKEIREHIFDPFYSGREAGRGLGFGLSKAWRIAEMHGGMLHLVNQESSGATFEVWLPLEVDQAATR